MYMWKRKRAVARLLDIGDEGKHRCRILYPTPKLVNWMRLGVVVLVMDNTMVRWASTEEVEMCINRDISPFF